jgi:GT2 family glycosyltransferase
VAGSATQAPRVLAAIAHHGDQNVPVTMRAVSSLLAAKALAAAALVVIDDGSGQSVVSRLREALPPGIELLALPRNGGYAHACNAAIRRGIDIGAEYVWLLNNDVQIPGGTIESLMETLDREPSWAAVAPATVAANDQTTVLGAGVSLSVTRARVRHLYTGRRRSDLPPQPYAVDAVEASALLVRTAALTSIGELDEGFRMYWEDIEWSVRARRRGWSLGVDPRATVLHHVSLSSTTEQRARWLILNRIRFSDLVANRWQRLLFRIYFLGGWLPAYAITRLIPRFGMAVALQMSWDAIRRASPGGGPMRRGR